MVIKALSFGDVGKIAEVHQVSFEGFFLTSLGRKFLETYYRACLADSKTIALGIFNEQGGLMGFATGTSEALGYHKKLFLKNFLPFVGSIILKAVQRPGVIYRLAKNLGKNPGIKDSKNYAELLSIAVSPALAGSGYGSTLLENFEAHAKLKGASRVALTTDLHDNDDVLAFYRKKGYEVYYDFTAYPSRRMSKMIKTLG